MTLICPVVAASGPQVPLHPGIEVVDAATLDSARMAELAVRADVIEIPGNFVRRGSGLFRLALKQAQRQGKLVILGISSNRSRTARMKAAGESPLRRARSRRKALSVRMSQGYLARRTDGVRVVGHGVAELVRADARALHVDIASWISTSDVRPPRQGQSTPIRVVIASRLEAMKGVALRITAIAQSRTSIPELELSVIGEGVEKADLQRLSIARVSARRPALPANSTIPSPSTAICARPITSC